jgi:hypothetical protein
MVTEYINFLLAASLSLSLIYIVFYSKVQRQEYECVCFFPFRKELFRLSNVFALFLSSVEIVFT